MRGISKASDMETINQREIRKGLGMNFQDCDHEDVDSDDYDECDVDGDEPVPPWIMTHCQHRYVVSLRTALESTAPCYIDEARPWLLFLTVFFLMHN